MSDGDNLILGHSNSAESWTILTRTAQGGDEDPLEALIVENPLGAGLTVRAGGVAGIAVEGIAAQSAGVVGFTGSPQLAGVAGGGSSFGVSGVSGSGVGVQGTCPNHIGVRGDSDSHVGIRGRSQTGVGMRGSSAQPGDGFNGGIGVHGLGTNGATAVAGASQGGVGVLGSATGGGLAGLFQGNVTVTGTLSASAKSFKIDHPLDPENRYLVHAAVESPDMKTIYDGIATLDDKGEATVRLAEWFEALNKDYRYQVTCIGSAAPDLHIATEISDNQFTIGGGPPNGKVSWQVTGIRRDSWAIANPVSVEQDKRTENQILRLTAETAGLSDALNQWAEEDLAETEGVMSTQRQLLAEFLERTEEKSP